MSEPFPKPTTSTRFIKQLYMVLAAELAEHDLPANQLAISRRIGEPSSRLGQWRKGKVQITLNKAVKLASHWNSQAGKMARVSHIHLTLLENDVIWDFELEHENG